MKTDLFRGWSKDIFRNIWKWELVQYYNWLFLQISFYLFWLMSKVQSYISPGKETYLVHINTRYICKINYPATTLLGKLFLKDFSIWFLNLIFFPWEWQNFYIIRNNVKMLFVVPSLLKLFNIILWFVKTLQFSFSYLNISHCI